MKLKGALVGCGAISRKHLTGFIENREECVLSAVCDIDKTRAEGASASYLDSVPGMDIGIFSDHREMLKETRPDFVVIATSSSYHYQITVDSLNDGAHTIIEKPIALSTIEADEIIELSRKKNLKTAVCYITRFAPHIQELYKAVKAGRFGRILNGNIQINWNRNNDYYSQAAWRGTWEKDGGALMNQCTHGIDLLQWLMDDEVDKVHGILRRFLRPIESEDFGAALLEFNKGGVGVIQGSVDVYPKNHDETLSLFGEKGTVVIGGNSINKVETWLFEDGDENESDRIKRLDTQFPGHAQLFEDFIHAVQEDRDPFITAEEGKKSIDIVLGMYKSMKEGKAVTLPVSFDTRDMKNIKLT